MAATLNATAMAATILNREIHMARPSSFSRFSDTSESDRENAQQFAPFQRRLNFFGPNEFISAQIAKIVGNQDWTCSDD